MAEPPKENWNGGAGAAAATQKPPTRPVCHRRCVNWRVVNPTQRSDARGSVEVSYGFSSREVVSLFVTHNCCMKCKSDGGYVLGGESRAALPALMNCRFHTFTVRSDTPCHFAASSNVASPARIERTVSDLD